MQSQSMGDSRQPTTERAPPSNARRLSRQNEKRRLVDILDIMIITKNTPANPLDAAPVTLDQRFERGFFTTVEKPPKQDRVARRFGHRRE
jgi:hypothetical protein